MLVSSNDISWDNNMAITDPKSVSRLSHVKYKLNVWKQNLFWEIRMASFFHCFFVHFFCFQKGHWKCNSGIYSCFISRSFASVFKYFKFFTWFMQSYAVRKLINPKKLLCFFFFLNVSSKERVKPSFFMAFCIIRSRIFPENFIEIPRLIQKI